MGRDKALLPWGESPERRTLLAHLLCVLGQLVPHERIVVAAAVGQRLPDLPRGVRVIRDAVAGAGPLPAVAAGLEALGDDDADAVIVLACDAPLATPAALALLAARLVEQPADVLAVVPRTGEQLHPLAAAYRPAAVAAMRDALAAGVRSLHGALARMNYAELAEEELRAVDPDLGLVANCNTPAELAAAREISRRR